MKKSAGLAMSEMAILIALLAFVFILAAAWIDQSRQQRINSALDSERDYTGYKNCTGADPRRCY